MAILVYQNHYTWKNFSVAFYVRTYLPTNRLTYLLL